MENKENVGAIHESPAENGAARTTPPTDPRPDWYVDLEREEFIRFRMLLARINGPLRMRIPTLIMSLVCCLTVLALAAEEWYLAGFAGYPDPVLLVGAVLVLVPGLYLWFYVPAKMKKTAAAQYDRSIQAGMSYCGRLTVCPEFIEKAGQSATAHIRLDERALFIENEEMMVFTAAGSPAVVLPARCMTEEMAVAVRSAADRIPTQNRKFIARLIPGGRTVSCPPPAVKPEELYVTTFTYTAEEYTTVLRGLMIQHFWRVSPITAATATAGALLFGWGDENLWMCLVYFLVIAGILTVFNLVLPLSRVKRQAQMLSPHDLTVQVRLDTMALRVKGQKTGENYVLWCDVDHVYDKGEFVEMVHNKNASLHIPKRAIEDIAAFEAVLNRCRGK